MLESDHRRLRRLSRFERSPRLLAPWNKSAGAALAGLQGYRMVEGFSKRDFAILAAALQVAGALTVGAVDFVTYHNVFQDTDAAPIFAK
jgi:hypothetical protein